MRGVRQSEELGVGELQIQRSCWCAWKSETSTPEPSGTNEIPEPGSRHQIREPPSVRSIGEIDQRLWVPSRTERDMVCPSGDQADSTARSVWDLPRSAVPAGLDQRQFGPLSIEKRPRALARVKSSGPTASSVRLSGPQATRL